MLSSNDIASFNCFFFSFLLNVASRFHVSFSLSLLSTSLKLCVCIKICFSIGQINNDKLFQSLFFF